MIKIPDVIHQQDFICLMKFLSLLDHGKTEV